MQVQERTALRWYLGLIALVLICVGMMSLLPHPETVEAQSNGRTVFRSAALTTAVTVTAVPTYVSGWYIYNPNSSPCSLDVFDAVAGSVTLGTTTPILSLVIPATSGANLAAPSGARFPHSVSIAAVTAAGGGTTCGTGMTVNLWYQ